MSDLQQIITFLAVALGVCVVMLLFVATVK